MPETRSDTVTDVKAEAIFDILAYTLAQVKPEKLTDKVVDLKAGRLDDIRH